LRGNDIFIDFFDNPEQTHKLLDFCTDAIKWSMDNQKKVIGSFFDGVITGMDVWLPGNSMGRLSEDTSSLCSPDNYREYGMPYTARLLENYRHTFMHTHASGIHNISNIASIDGIDVIEISNDPKSPRAIEIYKKLENVLNGKIVVVSITPDEIKENLEFLKKNRTIIWYYAKDMKDAKEAVSLVRYELPVNCAGRCAGIPA
jgi:uroporphyrinogen-III decarboxylase